MILYFKKANLHNFILLPSGGNKQDVPGK